MSAASESSSPSMVLGYEEAAAVVRAHARGLQARESAVEEVPLLEGAGRVLAAGVVADRDYPPFARSTRDGFACRAEEVKAGSLRIRGELRAGQAWSGGALGAGDAVEIMTGAAVPDGADCVVMVEHVAVEGERVALAAPRDISPGENIVPAGAEARKGGILAPRGRRMGAAEIASAAACGYSRVSVFPRPRVAILATGDELVGLGEAPLPHQIRNSNSYSLAAQAAAAGGVPVIFPVVPDEADETEQAIRKASTCDLVLLSGGVSMGKFDFVEQALERLGAEFFFTGARIQPGRPVVFGRLPTGYFLGLPGNPVSTMVTFALFAAPMLRGLAGESETEPRFVSAELMGEVRVKAGLRRFLPARMFSDVNGARVERIAWQGSGDLAAAARANCFVVVPEGRDQLAAGEGVAVLLL